MLDRRRVRGVIATLLFSTALLAAGSPVACRRGKASPHEGVESSSSRSEATAYVAGVESVELLVESALANFRARRGLAPAERRAAAERVLAAARSARENLESLRVPAAFEAAHREELFVNHVLPAFSDYLANDEDGHALRDLDGILQRGRAHQERAAEARAAAAAAFR